jgi:hypothetical protein
VNCQIEGVGKGTPGELLTPRSFANIPSPTTGLLTSTSGPWATTSASIDAKKATEKAPWPGDDYAAEFSISSVGPKSLTKPQHAIPTLSPRPNGSAAEERL